MGLYLSCEALTPLGIMGIKADFCGFGLFWRGFNEADLPGFELIRHLDD
ncbi:MAG: hypothetical protein JRD87_13350 [Deltaproteobacteria bacterium]|jgi:hypothetical protein|nr:hypothetical protein [Deltaproteobacteria bacterium]MBW2670840.1 hypothetical protein [Deltaproteobacteria bacterium]MBW2711020.1 hypothetical protein [Deltaproteobacteria bacterium]